MFAFRREQAPPRVAVRTHRVEEAGFGLGAVEQGMERFGVAGGIEGGVAGTEQSDVSGNVGCDDRHSRDHRLRNDVRASLHDRAHHHRVAVCEGAPDLPARHLAAPDVAGVGGHLGASFPLVGRVVRLAEMDDAELRRGRCEARRPCGPKRILLLAQMPDDADVERAARVRPGGAQRRRGLMNDPKLGPKPGRQVVRNEVVQAHESIRDGHRRRGLVGVAVLEAVDVGPRHEHHERPEWMPCAECGHGRRTAPRMDCHQEVRTPVPAAAVTSRLRPTVRAQPRSAARSRLRLAVRPRPCLPIRTRPCLVDRHGMPQRLQDAGPAHRSHPVAAP